MARSVQDPRSRTNVRTESDLLHSFRILRRKAGILTILFVVSRDWNFLVCSCLLQPKHDGIESTSLVSVTQETNERRNAQTNKQTGQGYKVCMVLLQCCAMAKGARDDAGEGTRELFHVAL